MILILTESNDQATQNVISHLQNKKANYKVLYGSDVFQKQININTNNNEIEIDNEILDNVNIVWYRRWLSSQHKFSEDLIENTYLSKEFDEFSSNFMLNITTKKWLNTPPLTLILIQQKLDN